MIVLVAALSVASADEISEPETCVIERYDSAHCEVCSDASYENEAACSDRLDADRDLACRTQGGSVWSEIWCDPGHTDPDAATSTGCTPLGGAASGGAAAILAVLGLLAGRRR